MSRVAFVASNIFDGDNFHQNSGLLVDGKKVLGLVSANDIPGDFNVETLNTGTLAPGFIDWQVNGGGGVLFNNQINEAGVAAIVSGHHQGGTTSLMPTLISDTLEARRNAFEVIKAIDSPSVLGLHLEGPFFSMEKRGTHHPDFIQAISDEDVDWLTSLRELKLILTLAPEQTSKGQIRALVDNGIIVSAGHSNATFDQAQEAIREGLSGFTHLYNAMRMPAGREPGVVGAALLSRDCWCGIIVDGHHVHPEMVRLAEQSLPTGKLCLVTDAMATVGSIDKSFELYGDVITEQNGALINAEGRLAGSAISMIDAVRISHKTVGLDLGACLKMASFYPAEFLNLDHMLGRLSSGYRADFIHFDNDFQVTQTWVAGQAQL